MTSLLAAAIAFAAFLGVATTADAAPRAFSERWGENVRGDITYAANTLMSCDPAVSANCLAQRSSTAGDNNNVVMFSVDVDGDPATGSSSRATLNLPAGASVEFAGLYWGGLVPLAWDPANQAERDDFLSIQLDTPAGGGYQPLIGQQFDNVATGNFDVWQGAADVTATVQAAGAGEYTVADVPLHQGPFPGGAGFGGWTLVVAYEAPGDSWRNLTVFDGFAIAPPAVNIPLSGFVTPPTGTFGTKLGFHTFEGDASFANDRVRLNGTALSDAINPANNMLNSRISRLGVDHGDRTPNYLNQLGYDSKIVDASGILTNGATSANVLFGDPADLNWPGLITTSIDLFAPNVTATKQIANLTDPGQPAEPNDALQYTITYANSPDQPNDPASDFVITDPIPANMTYIPNTLTQFSGNPGTGGRTDAAGDDTAEFDGTNAIFRVGSGADATNGGSLAPGEQVTVAFQVQVNAASPGHLSTNEATGNFRAVTLNEPLEETATASIPVIPVHDLSLDKSGPATVQPGQTLTYTLDVANAGPSTSNPTTLTDTLPAGLTYDDAASDNRCDAVGQDVTCGLGSLAGDGSDDTTVTIVAAVDPTAAGTLENDAEVTGSEPEANPNNNVDSVTTQIVLSSDLELTKTAPAGPHPPGALIAYTFSVRNDGPNDTPAALVTDTLPAGMTYVSDNAGCDTTNLPQISCSLGALANGATTTFTVTGRLPATPGASVTNSAAVSGPNIDPDPGDDRSSVSVAVASAPASAPTVTPDAEERRCFFGRRVTILGTEGPDRIVGTDGPDVIDGRRGADVILGLDGDDFICGGRGADLIKAGAGNDGVKGGPGDDKIRGNKGADWLRAGPGDDRVSGRPGNDRLMGNAGDDRLQGRKGRDILLGGPGNDWAKGGRGHDKAAGVTRPFGIERLFSLGKRKPPCPDRICDPD